jgi:hypothetical protein
VLLLLAVAVGGLFGIKEESISSETRPLL